MNALHASSVRTLNETDVESGLFEEAEGDEDASEIVDDDCFTDDARLLQFLDSTSGTPAEECYKSGYISDETMKEEEKERLFFDRFSRKKLFSQS